MSKIADYKIIRDCIFGHAVGDALGLPVQFMSREEIARNPVTDMFGYGVFNMPEGSWSDDTSMTLCALDALSDSNFSWDLVMENFVLWLHKGRYTPFGYSYDVGKTCLIAVEEYSISKDYTSCGPTGERDNGNGSLMRIIPFALYKPNDTAFIETASALTHAHPRSRLACVIYSFFLNEIIRTKNKNCLYDALNAVEAIYGQSSEWQYFEPLYEIERRNINSISGKGYVVDTLEASIWCLMTTENYKDCVLKAVNLGLDTDTVAAIAGGLAGALYGYESIPESWINKLQRKDYIDSLCIKAST